MPIEFTLNGNKVSVDVDEQTPLLEVLRNDIALNSPKFGCGLAQCGACAVQLDGVPIRSCVTPVAAAAHKSVTTLEGLGSAEKPHALQTAFIEEQAIQCGYCASGVIVTAAALLEQNPSPTDTQVKKALASHLCRCGAQPRMLKAIARVANTSSGDDSP
ncbi:MAG: (2Fe-2S)-binding protein [Woeseiaceae bacterium]